MSFPLGSEGNSQHDKQGLLRSRLPISTNHPTFPQKKKVKQPPKVVQSSSVSRGPRDSNSPSL